LKIQLRDIKFNVDNSFKPIYWEHINSGNWEPHTFDAIDNCVNEGSNVIDIGCWAGPLSLYMAGKGANVYAIDPDPEAYKSLLINLKSNPDLNQVIKPYNIAISQNTETVKLYARNGYGDSSTSVLNRTRDNVKNATCEGYRLDQFLRTTALKQVDFLKVDIEGGEFRIIDQLLVVKKQYDCTNLLLSLHYDHLNEFIYHKRIRNKFLSLLLMKCERFTGIYVFKKELVSHLKNIRELCQQFKFVYAGDGELLGDNKLTPQYLLKNKLDLFMSESEWIKHEITKPKLH